jgi:uncharacterized membrane protein SirB2
MRNRARRAETRFVDVFTAVVTFIVLAMLAACQNPLLNP